ncbi:uncharacterized protein L201_004383 [Kwoniella dendrophila CBS 6074]|uniref:Amidase domain-containing protein n=1 Tax=Kwoniella dendrophila CBS 6074 TaxID=1295534 RepID=A0AAX4JW50_9TREE
MPLSSLRISVKDIFDIKGLPTKAGSSIFAEWKGQVEDTAKYIDQLIQARANLVGKVKTSHPFSPRADGYQSCGSSFSGSASAMATYGWLDISIASDTDGSIRHPAAVVGLYGFRPSHGLIPVDGVLPALEWSDAVGLIARDGKVIQQVFNACYPAVKSPKVNTCLILSDDIANVGSDAWNIFSSFINELERISGMGSKRISISSLAPTQDDLLEDEEIPRAIAAWQWQQFGKLIYEDHQAKYQGRLAPFGHRVREAFKSAQYDGWGQDCLYVELTALDWLPTYREEKLNDKRPPLAKRSNPLNPYVPASVGGCPHIVIPIGQVPFQSLVSNSLEMQPICASLIGPPSSDLMILDLVDKLVKNGAIEPVKTGRTAFV